MTNFSTSTIIYKDFLLVTYRNDGSMNCKAMFNTRDCDKRQQVASRVTRWRIISLRSYKTHSLDLLLSERIKTMTQEHFNHIQHYCLHHNQLHSQFSYTYSNKRLSISFYFGVFPKILKFFPREIRNWSIFVRLKSNDGI